MATDKRFYPRAEVAWPVVTETPRQFMVGEIENISHGGAFIGCKRPLNPRDVFDMHFSVAPLGPRIKATAEVVWTNISDPDEELQPRGMGIRFLNISDKDRTVISTLISGYLKERGIDWREEEPGE